MEKCLGNYTFAVDNNLFRVLENSQIHLLYNVIGKRIRVEREKEGYKQTEFAQLLQISRASLVNIEQGRQRAPLHIIYEVARLLKIGVSDLLPNVNEIAAQDVNKELKEKIEKKSAGNKDVQEKLMDFVKSHSIPGNSTTV